MINNRIYVSYGDNPQKMIKELLAGLKIENYIKKDALIGIKPNLVVAKPAALGATTSPELAAGLIEYLQSKGLNNIVILEGSWVGEKTDKAFAACGYTEISKTYGVPLIDLQRDSSSPITVQGMEINICDQVLKVDYLINMPVLKGHCQTKITCALKNLKGCIPNMEKRKFHTLGLHKPIAYLNKAVKTDLIIVDGLAGDLDFEEGGNPVQMDRIILGFDPVSIDAYAAGLLGFAPDEIPYIKIAESIGVGSCLTAETKICEINKEHSVKKIPQSRKVQRLAGYIEEKHACSACYGSLIHALARLSEQGNLSSLQEKVHIGQGYKGIKSKGIGVGACTRGFECNVLGCPPTAKAIVDVLMDNVKR
ncbi:MAG: DUF362 domain-containing protein [Firmicutes bacterium]|nr:DUF362 domain-containing protein [Bacillota bacterium]